MARRATFLAAVFILVALAIQGRAQRSGEAADAVALPVARVHFEQNATDGDVEVVFEVAGRDDGLTKLTVVSPDGRTVADIAAPDGTTLGLRQFRLESPEPTDVAGLKAAYPEGVYQFAATSASGVSLRGRSTLSHQLPATTKFVRPQPEAEGVNARNLEIVWSPSADAVAYIIEIEQEGADVNLTAKLPKSATRFAMPSGFLQMGTEYQLGIGAVSAEGNASFVETNFTTAAQ